MIKTPKQFFLCLYLYSFLILALAGCATVSVPPPRMHVWDQLIQGEHELDYYGTYTYVLFKHEIEDKDQVNNDIAKRYKSLLDAIVESTFRKDENIFPPGESNIFYIPSIKKSKSLDTSKSLNNYDFSLSRKYINSFAYIFKDDKKIFQRITNRPGPFLITTQVPLALQSTGVTGNKVPLTAFLYVDLSEHHPDAMSEVVAEYKKRIISEPFGKAEVFEPLKLSFLNLILNSNENVRLILASIADFIPIKIESVQ